MDFTPAGDVVHVERLGSLHGEHIAGVVEILVTAPAEFLHHHVFGGGQPGLAVKLPGIPHHTAFELSLHKRVVKEFKQLHLERRTSFRMTDVSASPGERVKLDMSAKNKNPRRKRRGILEEKKTFHMRRKRRGMYPRLRNQRPMPASR